jgi:hypothetical protein
MLLVVPCLLPLAGCVEESDSQFEPTGGTTGVYLGPSDPPSPPPPPPEIPPELAPYAPAEAPTGYAWVPLKGNGAQLPSSSIDSPSWSVAFDATSQPVTVYGAQASTQGPEVIWALVKANDVRLLPANPYQTSWKRAPVIVAAAVVTPPPAPSHPWAPVAAWEHAHPRAAHEAREAAAHPGAAHHAAAHAVAHHTEAAHSHHTPVHKSEGPGAHAPAGLHHAGSSIGGHFGGGHAGGGGKGKH